MRYWIGLGANLGDRAANLRRAGEELGKLGPIHARSRIYVTAPVGGPPQGTYLNAALELSSELRPEALLAHALDIERGMGRERGAEVRWGPRLIDIDLLLAGDDGELTMVAPGLELPHPRLAERAFALAPLVDLAPQLMHPRAHRTLSALLRDALRDGSIAVMEERL